MIQAITGDHFVLTQSETRAMKKSGLIQYTVGSACFIGLLQACSTTRSLPPASPTAPTPTANATVEARNTTWSPQIVSGRWRYLIQDSSRISINNDTTTRVEPIESTTIYTISVRDSNNSLLLTGHIDSLLVNSHLSTKPRSDTSTATTLNELISRQGHLMRVTNTVPATCGAGTLSSSSRLAELLTILPDHPVKIGDKWSDTTSATTCHGKIPLTRTAVREYELLDFSSCPSGGVRVRRIASDSFTGSSAESVNHLSASGSGTATSILCLDRNTGALISSDGQSRLELIVTTTRGVFPFTQNTNTHIKLR